MQDIKTFVGFLWLCIKKASDKSIHKADAIYGGFGLTIVTSFFGWMGIKMPIPDTYQYAEQSKAMIYFLSILGATWLIRFICSPFWMWKEAQNEIINLKKQITPIDDLEKMLPSLIVGQDTPYEKTASLANQRLNRTVFVGIKNNNAKEFLSNCRVFLVHRKEDDSIGTVMLENTFDIPPKVERFIAVAYYISSTIPDASHKTISLCLVHGGFFSYEYMPLVNKKHLVTIRLETHETILAKLDCYLWVDNGKLKLEKV